MDAANALLLGAVMRVDIGAPVGGKTGLNGGDKLGQGVGEIKRTLLRRGGVIALKKERQMARYSGIRMAAGANTMP